MLTMWQRTRDELGPEKVLLIHEPLVGLEAIVVVDNTAAGPAIGGLRMAEDITVDEVARLARAMTFKSAAAGLSHGGGKAGIVGDPGMPRLRRERLVRAFADSIRDLTDYIPGPDMGIDESCMAVIHDEIGRAVGLPVVLGGIPLDSLGATAFGLAVAADVLDAAGIVTLDGARIVIQGFGAVGTHTARFLTERGAIVMAVSDSRGGVVNDDGLDVEKLLLWKVEGRPVREFPGGTPCAHQALLEMNCDIWIPAARPDVFTRHTARLAKTKVVLPGANIAVTPDAERLLYEHGVVSLPDFIVNAGGVICGAAELAGSTARQAFDLIEERVRANTSEVLERAARDGVMPMTAARAMAEERVDEMMGYRRRF